MLLFSSCLSCSLVQGEDTYACIDATTSGRASHMDVQSSRSSNIELLYLVCFPFDVDVAQRLDLYQTKSLKENQRFLEKHREALP